MSKLGDFKQIARQAAHELTGTVSVKKFIAERLHMPKQIATDIRLYANAKGMPPIADHKIQKSADQIGCRHRSHHCEKDGIGIMRQEVVHRPARYQRKRQIDCRNQQRTDHVGCKQAAMRLKIAEKNSE